MEHPDRDEVSGPDEGRYRLLIDAITDYAIYMLDPTGRVTSWNPGAQRFKGYTADEILGEHFSRFYTDEEREAGLPAIALKTAQEEGRFEREGWRVRKDGSRFWAHVVIDPVRSRSGELLGFAKITRDLTERKAATEALQASEQQFRLLVQGVTDYAIYMLDREGNVASWNAGAERIKGYAPAEVVGSHFSRFYTEEDRAAGVPSVGLATARREGRWEQEGLRVRKDGVQFWAHVVIDAIRNDQGEVIGFAKVTRDITERKQTQIALEKAQAALLQSQKMEAVGQLTGGIAHDFNNLLAAVLGSLELLRKRLPPDPKLAALIDNAMQGAQRGSALTQRMLAFARRQELKLVPVDLRSAVRAMSGFLQRTIGPSVRVETRFPPSLPSVTTDPSQLETSLLNLGVNARDAMPEGGVITISARTETVASQHGSLAPGAYVVLAVRDTGTGMDEATLAKAMEPFFTTKGVGKGTGLGLSMVHGLAVQSGGDMKIESELGKGTTVELWLPAAAEPAAQSEADASEESERPRLVVLVVDDDPLVLNGTAAQLEDLGHYVIQAASGPEALAALRHQEDVDIVVTDQVMPLMTGLQLRDAILKDRPGLPVLLATGFAELPPEAESVPRLSKPFSQRDLEDALERTLAGSAAGLLGGAAANHLLI